MPRSFWRFLSHVGRGCFQPCVLLCLKVIESDKQLDISHTRNTEYKNLLNIGFKFGVKIVSFRYWTQFQYYEAFNDKQKGVEGGGELQQWRHGIQKVEPVTYRAALGMSWYVTCLSLCVVSGVL